MASSGTSTTQPQQHPPVLHGSGFAASLVRQCPSFQRGFNPPAHLRGPHRQTLAGVARELFPPSLLLSSRRRKKKGKTATSSDASSLSSWSFRRQLVHCDDGGTIALDWWEPDRKKRNSAPSSSSPSSPPLLQPSTAPMLLVLHGLTGGSSEAYVRSLCAHASAKGFRAAAVVYRGCGGLRLTSRRAYSATLTGDVAAAARAARRSFPLAPSVSAVGFSLGAVILAKYLGEQDGGYWDERGKHHHGHGMRRATSSEKKKSDGGGEESDDDDDDDLIDAAVAVSSPFCLESAAVKISAPWTVGWLYNFGLALRLKHYMIKHRHFIFSSSSSSSAATATAATSDSNGNNSEHPIDVRALATSYLVSHIDDAASARACGYEDRASYYSDAATRAQIPHVTRTPLLFVASGDDPFLGDLPVVEVERNPRTAMVLTERGGHCAFLDDDDDEEEEEESSSSSSAWVDRLACEWLSLVLEATTKKKKRSSTRTRASPLSRL